MVYTSGVFGVGCKMDYPNLELASVSCAPPPAPRRSTRTHPWWVYPLNEVGVYDLCGNGPKVLCGHLFNAESERQASGLTAGQGEECCISLEPIADACLSFEPDLRVKQLYPEFTGVELNCGHRFSAVSLLYHWCLSPMVCPVCRTKYALDGAEPTQCCPGNFPLHACNKLSRRINEIKRVEDEEQETADRNYIMSDLMQDALENVVYETITRVMVDPRSFHLILTLQSSVSPDVVRCIPLYRCSDSGLTNRTRFIAQRAHLRRFNSESFTDPTEGRDAHTSHNLDASLVIRDPNNADRMVEVSRLTLVEIEAGIPFNEISTPCINIQGHLDFEVCHSDSNSGVPRILSLGLNIDTGSLLEAVARLFTYHITFDTEEADTTNTLTTLSISPPDESQIESESHEPES